MHVLTFLGVCEVRCCTFVRVCWTPSACTSLFTDKGVQSACSLKSLLTLSPKGTSMHSYNIFFSSPELRESVPRLPLSPLTLLRSDCPVGLQSDSEPPQGLAALWAEKTTSCAAGLSGLESPGRP